MSAEDPIARLIPWYATGTLDSADSARVEAHLSDCEACRELLAVARGFRRLAPRVSRDRLFDHVQSQRLVEFAADPASLEPDARRIITTHIKSCEVCAEALEILESLGRDPLDTDLEGTAGVAERAPRGGALQAWKDLWRRLSRTVLHPVPALAYLAALAILLAVLPLRAPGPQVATPPSRVEETKSPEPAPPPRPAVTVMPPAVDLPGEIQFRGRPTPLPPASIPWRPGGPGVILSLVTDLDPEDLQDPDATFHVEVVQEGRQVIEERRHSADFDRRGRLLLLLAPEAIVPGVPCRVRLLLEKPGDRRDGEELYRRTFLLVEDSGRPR